jgi:copper chaperone CopZ
MTRLCLRNFVFCLLFAGIAIPASAQFRQASIGINGLTCSQCSRNVEMQLRKLDFISAVDMDLEHKNGTLHFKDNSKVDMSAIAKAVKDAGFSVRYLKADISSNDIRISDEGCFKLNGDVYYVSEPGTRPEPAILTLQFLGRDYLSKNELKQYKLPATLKCKGKTVYYTVPSAE